MRKNIKQLFPILFILLGLFLSSFNSDKKGVVLRINPELGKTYSYKTIMTQVTFIKGQMISTFTGTTMDMTATEKTDSLVTFQSQATWLKYKQTMMGQTISFDSDHPEETSPQLAKTATNFDKLRAKTFSLVYDVYGNVVSLPEEYPNSNQTFTPIFPKEEVFEGCQWTSESDALINGINTKNVTTYAVKSITDNETEIEITGTIASETMNGTINGNMMLNNKTGYPKIAKMDISMTMDGSEFGVSIPVKSDLSITISTQQH